MSDVRPIDANALSSLLFKRMGEYETLANDLPKHSYEGCVYYGKVTALYEAQLAIDRIIPTLDYAPVRHGEWVDNVDENGFLLNAWRKCSVCDGLNYSKKPSYCPSCGAKMDGGKKDG